MVSVAVELGHEGHVEAFVEQGGDGVVVGHGLQADLGTGHPLSEGAQHRCEPLVVGAALRHQSDGLMSAAGEVAQVDLGRSQLAERHVGGVEHASSGCGGDQPPAPPVEQGCGEAFLETQEALTQGWLADVEVAGGRRQRLVLAEGVQQLEVAHVDIHKLTLDLLSKMRRGRMDRRSYGR